MLAEVQEGLHAAQKTSAAEVSAHEEAQDLEVPNQAESLEHHHAEQKYSRYNS